MKSGLFIFISVIFLNASCITNTKNQLDENLKIVDSLDSWIILSSTHDNGRIEIDTSCGKTILVNYSHLNSLNPKSLSNYIVNSETDYPLSQISICVSDDVHFLKKLECGNNRSKYLIMEIINYSKENNCFDLHKCSYTILGH